MLNVDPLHLEKEKKRNELFISFRWYMMTTAYHVPLSIQNWRH